MKVEIIRLEESEGTFGVLAINGSLFCWTIERPDVGNIPNVSCIPLMGYECKRVLSPKFGDTFEIMNVPDRTHILFHVANFVDDLLGCIGLGKEIGKIGQRRAVIESRAAFNAFMKRLDGIDSFELLVRKI